MIISHGRRYIFVHIPKTGGTSLSLALEDKAKKDDILVGDTPKAKNRRKRLKDIKTSGRLWKHSRLQDIYGAVTQEQIQNYYVFTIVRNPWDRMVSYYHWLKLQKFDHIAVNIAQKNDFKMFLLHPVIRQSLRNDTVKQYVSDQSGVDRCNMYLCLETLEQDVEQLEKHLGLYLIDLPHNNKSERNKDYRIYYDTKCKNAIGDIFADDISQFGYCF